MASTLILNTIVTNNSDLSTSACKSGCFGRLDRRLRQTWAIRVKEFIAHIFNATC